MIASDAVQHSGDVMRRLADLERQVRVLQAGRRLEAATIGRGGLTVKDGGGVTIRDGGDLQILDGGDVVGQGGSLRFINADGVLQVYMGPIFYGSVPAGSGMILYRHNGGIYFSLEGTDPDSQFWALRDEVGNIVASDDSAAGQGLATPYIPLGAYPTRLLLTFATDGEQTTSSTFGPLWTIHGHKQHPRLRVGVYVYTDVAGTNAEIRLRDNTAGTVVAGPTAVSATSTPTVYDLTGPIAGAHLAEIKAEVEVRRTSGTGTVWVQLAYAEGIQS